MAMAPAPFTALMRAARNKSFNKNSVCVYTFGQVSIWTITKWVTAQPCVSMKRRRAVFEEPIVELCMNKHLFYTHPLPTDVILFP